MERAIQEGQEETDEQGKVKEQVGTGALEPRDLIRRIVVKKRTLVFYGTSKAQKNLRKPKRKMGKIHLQNPKRKHTVTDINNDVLEVV